MTLQLFELDAANLRPILSCRSFGTEFAPFGLGA